jgi:hypothetical protein
MAVTTSREFDLTETVEIYVEVYNQSDILCTPTSVEVTITAPDGTAAQAKTAMTEITTGKYNYYYTTVTQKGWYPVVITVTDTTKITLKKGGFNVK